MERVRTGFSPPLTQKAQVLKHPRVVFRGEGEEVFPQWLTCWNHPEQWHTVPGLCYLTPNKEYKDNGIARVLNFAGLVPPEQSRFFNWSKPFVQLETTRGLCRCLYILC